VRTDLAPGLLCLFPIANRMANTGSFRAAAEVFEKKTRGVSFAEKTGYFFGRNPSSFWSGPRGDFVWQMKSSKEIRKHEVRTSCRYSADLESRRCSRMTPILFLVLGCFKCRCSDGREPCIWILQAPIERWEHCDKRKYHTWTVYPVGVATSLLFYPISRSQAKRRQRSTLGP